MNDKFKKRNRVPSHRKKGPGRKRLWGVLSGAMLLCLFVMGYLFFFPSKLLPPPVTPVEPIPPPSKAPDSKEPETQVIEGQIKGGSTFFNSLKERNIPPRWINLVVSKLKPYVNFKKIKGGNYQFVADLNGTLVKFIYETGPTEVYEVEKDAQGYIARKKEISLETYLVKAMGEIHSSLFEAMDAIGEQDPLTIAFAEILAWEIDSKWLWKKFIKEMNLLNMVRSMPSSIRGERR